MVNCAVVALVLAAAPADPADSERIKIAVMAITGSPNIPAELISSLTSVVPQVLDDLGPFKAISSDDITQMLQMETLRQKVGCDDVACLAEIGGALGAAYMISGSVVLVGPTYLLQFRLMNIQQGRVEERITREHKGDLAGLLEATRSVTKMLVRQLMALHAGMLRVQVSEEGASIRLDDSIVGVSPMAAFEAGGGMHTITVEKEGFVVFRKDVEVRRGSEVEVVAQLLPSDDYKNAYTARAGLVRALAWAGVGVGAAAVAGGMGMMVGAEVSASGLAADIEAFNAGTGSLPRTMEDEQALRGRVRMVATLDAAALTAWLVGAAAAATGLVLLLAGDDPGRFDTSVDTPATVWLDPTGLKVTF